MSNIKTTQEIINERIETIYDAALELRKIAQEKHFEALFYSAYLVRIYAENIVDETEELYQETETEKDD